MAHIAISVLKRYLHESYSRVCVRCTYSILHYLFINDGYTSRYIRVHHTVKFYSRCTEKNNPCDS